MGRKAGHKATKKFAKSGQLKKTIQARHKQRNVKKRVERKKARTAAREKDGEDISGEEEEEEDVSNDEIEDLRAVKGKKSKTSGITVDDILQGKFMEEDVDEEGNSEEDDGESDARSDGSFASVDDLDELEKTHKLELAKLAEKDPEFYEYLKTNDKELLDFDPDAESDLETSEDVDEEVRGDERTSELTKEELNRWQKSLLERSSLRALRKLLLAFRSAVRMNDDDDSNSQRMHYSVNNPSVYNKLVVTALRYTPVVLQHHIPCRTLSTGKIKPPTQNAKQKALSKLVLSYFHNIMHLLKQVTDVELQSLALSEGGKIVPYISTSRKALKTYLKTCMELWSSAADEVRIAAFLSVRQLATAFDDSILDMLLKSSYLALVRSCKHTTGFSLPSINLMKNTAAELYCTNQSVAYQHAFRYIRQLAIHLRMSLKTKTKESHKQVYNWQYAHSVDFWAIVLSQTCDAKAEAETRTESDLKPLIYPLVQVALGSISLVSSPSSFPFHLQIIRSLLRITQRTRVYIPIAPFLIPILQSVLSPTAKHKPSTLKPLDFEVSIRAPSQYSSTRIYSETLTEETIYLFAEWLGSHQIQCSIAFPELIVPITVALRKSVKASKGGKEAGLTKQLIEHAEEGAKWIQNKRRDVKFGPGNREEVMKWEDGLKVEDSPMARWLKVLRKQREKRKQLVEKARTGEGEVLVEDSD